METCIHSGCDACRGRGLLRASGVFGFKAFISTLFVHFSKRFVQLQLARKCRKSSLVLDDVYSGVRADACVCWVSATLSHAFGMLYGPPWKCSHSRSIRPPASAFDIRVQALNCGHFVALSTLLLFFVAVRSTDWPSVGPSAKALDVHFFTVDSGSTGVCRENGERINSVVCVRERVRAARGYGGPREWVLTAALAEAARGPAD